MVRLIVRFLTVTALILWATFGLLQLTGCRVTQQRCQQLYPPPPGDTSVSASMFIHETIHDTTIIVPEYVSFFEALVQCDRNNQVVVEELAQRQGIISHYAWTVAKMDSTNRAIRARFTCKCDSQAIYIALKSLDTTIREATVVKQPYPVIVEKDLTRWQRFKIDWGDWGFALIAFSSLASILYAGAMMFGKSKGV